MTELVKKEEYNLISEDDFDYLVRFDEMKKRYNVIVQKVDQAGQDYLEQNGLESYKQTRNGITIHLCKTKPYKKKQCDTKKMKEEGVYELYTRDVWVKGSLRVQIDYDGEEADD